MKPEVSKLKSLDQFPQPATNRQVCSFLGLTGYYRRFIPDYRTIAVPLTNLFHKKVGARDGQLVCRIW